MICKECGAALADTAKFCNSCGAPVVRAFEESAAPEPTPAPAPEEPVSSAADFGFGPETASPFGSDLPPVASIFPPAPEAEPVTETPAPAEPEPAAPAQPEPEIPEGDAVSPAPDARVRVHTVAGTAALALLWFLCLTLLPALVFLHALASVGGANALPELSDALFGVAESPWPLAGLLAVTAVAALDLWLLNYRRVRRAFSGWGFAAIFAGLAVGACGALLTSLAPHFPKALASAALTAPNALRDLLLLFALVYLCLGAVDLCIRALIRIYRRGVGAKTARRPKGIKLALLILNILALVFCLLCAFLYLRAYVF